MVEEAPPLGVGAPPPPSPVPLGWPAYGLDPGGPLPALVGAGARDHGPGSALGSPQTPERLGGPRGAQTVSPSGQHPSRVRVSRRPHGRSATPVSPAVAASGRSPARGRYRRAYLAAIPTALQGIKDARVVLAKACQRSMGGDVAGGVSHQPPPPDVRLHLNRLGSLGEVHDVNQLRRRLAARQGPEGDREGVGLLGVTGWRPAPESISRPVDDALSPGLPA
jgi:hypothetical protein